MWNVKKVKKVKYRTTKTKTPLPKRDRERKQYAKNMNLLKF